MKRLSISLYNKSPFSIATSRAVGNVQESLDFIRGTLIRGALASIWIKCNDNKADNDFKKIFTGDNVAFGNLYFNGANPVPFSALTCKYYSGFKGDSNKNGVKHGVYDILLPLIREKEKNDKIPDEFQHCNFSGCGNKSPMKKHRDYYKKKSSDYFITENVKKRLVYHTAISHLSETALEKTLYSQEVVESEQNFSGDIWVYDETLLMKLSEFIDRHKFIYIGSDKSTGLGRFEFTSLESVEIVEISDIQQLKERISIFNHKLNIENGNKYFSVTLLSDAMITDKYMRYKSFIDQDDMKIKGAELILGISQSIPVQGWNSMAKIPKEDMMAIEKGSVFVFRTKKIDDILDALYKAEVSGIGKRRGEGFGRFIVCDTFHCRDGRI